MLEKFNSSPINQPEANSLEKKSGFERVKEKAGKFLKRVKQVGFVLILAGIIDYQLTHNNEIESKNIDGKEIFEHSDKETTHILNYLGGLDSLSDEERLKFMKEYSRGFDSIDIPDGYDKMTESETMFFLVNHFYNTYRDDYDSIQQTQEELTEVINDAFPKKYQYNDTIYKKLWEVEKECGSPKINWTFGRDRHMLSSRNDLSPHYNPFTHTVFIEANSHGSNTQIEDIVSEWSHAKQFHDHPTGSTLQAIEDGIRTAKDILKSKHKDYIISQLKEYNTLGSLEYDAHKIIEPYIENKFKDIKSIRSNRKIEE